MRSFLYGIFSGLVIGVLLTVIFINSVNEKIDREKDSFIDKQNSKTFKPVSRKEGFNEVDNKRYARVVSSSQDSKKPILTIKAKTSKTETVISSSDTKVIESHNETRVDSSCLKFKYTYDYDSLGLNLNLETNFSLRGGELIVNSENLKIVRDAESFDFMIKRDSEGFVFGEIAPTSFARGWGNHPELLRNPPLQRMGIESVEIDRSVFKDGFVGANDYSPVQMDDWFSSDCLIVGGVCISLGGLIVWGVMR